MLPNDDQKIPGIIDFWCFHSTPMEYRFGRDRTTDISQSGSSFRDLPAVVVYKIKLVGYLNLLMEQDAVKAKEVGLVHWQAW